MPWHKTGAIHYHKQLGLPDKGRAIKKVDCLLGVTSPDTPRCLDGKGEIGLPLVIIQGCWT